MFLSWAGRAVPGSKSRQECGGSRAERMKGRCLDETGKRGTVLILRERMHLWGRVRNDDTGKGRKVHDVAIGGAVPAAGEGNSFKRLKSKKFRFSMIRLQSQRC